MLYEYSKMSARELREDIASARRRIATEQRYVETLESHLATAERREAEQDNSSPQTPGTVPAVA